MDEIPTTDCQSCGSVIEATEGNRRTTRLENNAPDGYTAHFLWLCDACWKGLLANAGEWAEDDEEGQSPPEAESDD